MKKILFVLCIPVMVLADDIRVTAPLNSLSKEYFSSRMTGRNSHAGMIGNREYPDVWSYYGIVRGNTPESFVLEPLSAMSPDRSRTLGWNNHPILTSDRTGGKIIYPALPGHYLAISKASQGGAFSFRNPLDREILLIVEGNLNYNKNADIYIYRKTAGGEITLLADNKNKDALREVSNTFPDGSVRIRHYLKLQLEVKLAKNDTLVFAGFLPEEDSAKAKDRPVFYINDKWGAAWNPAFFIENTENAEKK